FLKQKPDIREEESAMLKQLLMAIIGGLALVFSATAWAGERTVNLKGDGMSCAMGAQAARKALEQVKGVNSAKIEGSQATMLAHEKVQETDLVKAIAGAGFDATVAN